MTNTQTQTVQKPRLPKILPDGKIHAIGRRKESVARVFLKPNGSGQVIVNGKPAEQYFAADGFIKDRITQVILKPFVVTGTMNRYDVIATCRGGGFTGQMEAIRLGIARALVGSQSGLPDRSCARKGCSPATRAWSSARSTASTKPDAVSSSASANKLRLTRLRLDRSPCRLRRHDARQAKLVQTKSGAKPGQKGDLL
jgi:ribosomal protein S9